MERPLCGRGEITKPSELGLHMFFFKVGLVIPHSDVMSRAVGRQDVDATVDTWKDSIESVFVSDSSKWNPSDARAPNYISLGAVTCE